MPISSRIEKVRNAIEEHLTTLNSDSLVMNTLGVDTLEKSAEIRGLTFVELESAAAAVKSNTFMLVVRDSDEFSSHPYVWISLKPQPVELAPGESVTPPDPCTVATYPDGLMPTIKEGVLVFSSGGTAMGYMSNAGLGDFNIFTASWDEFKKRMSPNHEYAVFDYMKDTVPRLIPLR